MYYYITISVCYYSQYYYDSNQAKVRLASKERSGPRVEEAFIDGLMG